MTALLDVLAAALVAAAWWTAISLTAVAAWIAACETTRLVYRYKSRSGR